jgi:hypothetical protein
MGYVIHTQVQFDGAAARAMVIITFHAPMITDEAFNQFDFHFVTISY